MSPIKEKFIEAIKALPYDIDEELKTKETIIILQDVTHKYVELFGTDDLNENDKMCIQSILTARKPQKMFQEKNNQKGTDLVMKTQNEEIKMEKIVDLLKKSEENDTFFDSLYNLYVLIGIAKGVNEMNQGNGISLEDFLAEREALYENYSRKFG